MTAETIIAKIRNLEPKEVEKVAAFFRKAERRKRQIKYKRNDAEFRRTMDKVFKDHAPLLRMLAKWERKNEPVKK